MTMRQETLTTALRPKKTSGWLQNFARKLVLAKLKNLQHGQLTLIENGQIFQFGNAQELAATITVLDAHFYGDIAFGGSIGAGEAYMLGYWQADNLTNVVRLMASNQSVMDTLEGEIGRAHV